MVKSQSLDYKCISTTMPTLSTTQPDHVTHKTHKPIHSTHIHVRKFGSPPLEGGGGADEGMAVVLGAIEGRVTEGVGVAEGVSILTRAQAGGVSLLTSCRSRTGEPPLSTKGKGKHTS